MSAVLDLSSWPPGALNVSQPAVDQAACQLRDQLPGQLRGRQHRTHSGFTLIELVITLALVGILALGALPFSQMVKKRTQEVELKAALKEIRTALDAYKEASDLGLIERSASSTGYPPDLDTLTTGVKNIRDPKAGLLLFLRRVPRDPFFTGDASVASSQTWSTRAYGTPLGGPAGGDDVFDVTSQSTEVGINGIPYDQW